MLAQPARTHAWRHSFMPTPNLPGTCLTSHQLESYAQGKLQGEAALDFEEHLEGCAICQEILAELFESGQRPDWLKIESTGLDPTRISSADDSTLGPANARPSPANKNVRSPAALGLWQAWTGASSIGVNASSTFPSTIGRYRIEGELGSGGFGQVFLAHDQKLHRKVALKVPHHFLHQQRDHWDLLLAEAQTVAALDHPAIVPIYDVAATDDVPMFLVSKLIEGSTLSAQLSGRQYSAVQAVQLIQRIADALQYAHERGVIHRDIKPQNILLDQAGEVYLTDFGLAWRIADRLRKFSDAGTPFYMSPEQLRGDSQAVDARSDVYSLARVLQQMLGGFCHWAESSQSQGVPPDSVLDGASDSMVGLSQSHQPVASLPPHIPGGLRAICAKATALAPAERYQSAAEFSQSLQRFIHSQTPILKRYRRLMLAVGMAFMACLIFLTLGFYGISRTAARVSAEQNVEALLQADPATLAHRASSDALLSPWAQPLLRAASHSGTPDKQLRARLGLMRSDPALVAGLAEDQLNSPVELSRALIACLTPHASQLCPTMWHTLNNDPLPSRRLNAAAYLAIAASDDERWLDKKLIDQLLTDLVGDAVSDRKHRIESLQSKREVLLDAVHRANDAMAFQVVPQERLDFNNVWELLVENDLPRSIDLMLSGPPHIFSRFLNRLNPSNTEAIGLLQAKLHQVQSPSYLPMANYQQRHLAAMALLKLGHEQDYWPLWCSSSNPSPLTVQMSIVGYEPITRDCFIARLRRSGAMSPVESLPEELGQRLFRSDLSERRNLLLALTAAQFKFHSEKDGEFLDQLRLLYRRDADACVHAIAKQLLMKADQPLPELEAKTRSPDHNGAWFVNSLNELMVILPPSPAARYRLAIANCEVQRQHFELFLAETNHTWTGVRQDQESDPLLREPSCAQGNLSWYDAAAFCNWLSGREGLDECYVPNVEGKYAEGMSIRANVQQLSGYRLPTQVEWENAGRAGVSTNLYFGDTTFCIRDYVWYMSNGLGSTRPVGRLRPNQLGLFDIHGNVSEWTIPLCRNPEREVEIRNELELSHHGGSVISSRTAEFHFSHCDSLHPQDRSRPTGLRVVRTLLPTHSSSAIQER